MVVRVGLDGLGQWVSQRACRNVLSSGPRPSGDFTLDRGLPQSHQASSFTGLALNRPEEPEKRILTRSSDHQ
jgi:hypothetical protein